MLRNYRNIFFYAITLIGFTAVILAIIHFGRMEETARVETVPAQAGESPWQHFRNTYGANFTHPLAILLLQIITIILVARVFGVICKKIRQPTVIGEIAAGIFLGPSFIGQYLPEYSAFLFPRDSLSNLQFLSQIGLILFMFVVGMELDLKILKKKARDAVIISHASIIFPFTLGILLAYFMYSRFAPPAIGFLSFSLFIGIAMSITAFPVLARIVQEKGLSKTKLGALAITCAAADDITAWCLLAAVIAVVKAGSVFSSLYTIAFAALYVYFMLKLARPFLKTIGDKYANREGLSKPVVAVFFFTLLFSSYITELIGIHALFGAFMAGVVMPSNVRFRSLFIEKVEDVSLVLLLPLFFVFTGLRTEIGLLNTSYLWMVCLLVVLVAVAGKFLGSALAARFVGQTWRESLTIGALMNTRGLMELVVLNIGYDLGVLSPEIFAMMVIMALVTTVMTAPALNLISRRMPDDAGFQAAPVSSEKRYNILVSFGSPEKGVTLVRVANALVRNSGEQATITAMHLSPSTEINQFNFHEYEVESFRPIRQEAKKLKQPVNLFFKPSRDIEAEIAQTANQGNFSLLIMGMGESVFEGTVLGNFIGYGSRLLNPVRVFDALSGKRKLFERYLFDERLKEVVKDAHIPLAIVVDRKPEAISSVLVYIVSAQDAATLDYATRFAENGAAVTVVYPSEELGRMHEVQAAIEGLRKRFPASLTLAPDRKMDKGFLKQSDLLLLSMNRWKNLAEQRTKWLAHAPTVMMLK
jgi:Kef-type K+ transport system membrane component KefB